jgi:hypothetical protein
MIKYLLTIFLMLPIINHCICEEKNLMQNPGAEECILFNKCSLAVIKRGVEFAEKIPLHSWSIEKSCGICKFGISEKEKHNGKNSVFCQIKEKNRNEKFKFYIRLTEDLNCLSDKNKQTQLKPATLYYLSFWAKAKGHLLLTIRLDEKLKGQKRRKLQYVCLNGYRYIYPVGKWKKYEIAFITSPDAEKSIPAIQILSTDYSLQSDVVYLDDIKIMEFNNYKISKQKEK